MDQVVYLSHQLGGFDGVSVEADKWMVAFRHLGFRVTPAAGRLHRSCATGLSLPSLWRPEDASGRLLPPPSLTTAEIQAVLNAAGGRGGLAVLDNIATMPTAADNVCQLVDALESAGVALLIRHHDPSWEEASRLDDPRFPLRLPGGLHVAISRHLSQQLWIRCGINAQVMHNPLVLDSLLGGDRPGTRQAFGLHPDDLVLLHPAIPYPRKNTPLAARFADAVTAQSRRRVVYWLTGGPDPLAGAGRYFFVTGQWQSPADLYAAADAVLLPSTWEGWGNPVTEAAALDLPVVTGSWPALEEMRQLGVRDIPVTATDAVQRLLAALQGTTNHRVQDLRAALDGSRLPADLERMLQRLGFRTSPQTSQGSQGWAPR